METSRGLAVCDTDPFKLHYAWSLWRIGEMDRSVWRHEAAAARLAFEQGQPGFADLYLVEIPGREELRARRDGDPTRRRRNFELHSRLGETLREWYRAVDSLEPGHVFWQLPDQPLTGDASPRRRQRTGAALFNKLMAALPAA